MAKPKRTTKKTTDKTAQIASKNTTKNETTTIEPVAIKPMVPRTAPLNELTETASAACPAAVSEEVIVQFGGKELSSKNIMERAKQAYKDNGQTAEIASITAYVKPEENKVYFVINNDYQGSLDY